MAKLKPQPPSEPMTEITTLLNLLVTTCLLQIERVRDVKAHLDRLDAKGGA